MMNAPTFTNRDDLTASDRAQVARAGETTRHILVATDGSRTAGAALRLTAEMLRSAPGHLTVLTILEPGTSYVKDVLFDGGRLLRDDVRTHNVLDRVALQLRSLGLNQFALRVAFGRPGPTIDAIARELDASLIVMGLASHRWLSRLLGDETATGILPYAGVPVLAVHREARALPSSALCAIDFGESGMTAALAAERLLETGGTLHLAHVAPRLDSVHEQGWERIYKAGVESGFGRLRAMLKRGDIAIVSHLLNGAIAPELLRLAERANVGLVSLGRHNESGIAAGLIGSTPESVVRAAKCSVLVAPYARSEAPSVSLPHEAVDGAESELQKVLV